MDLEYKTGAVVTLMLIDCLRGMGVTPSEIESRTGIDQMEMNNLEVRIPIGQHIKLWQFACEATGDSALAINLQKYCNNETTHFINVLAASSRNGIEAMINLKRYAKIVSEADQFDLRDMDKNMTVVYDVISHQNLNSWLIEYSFYKLFEYGRGVIYKKFSPIEVTFRHSCAGDIETYENFFKAPVRFNQTENRFVCRKQDLLKPLVHTNSHLHIVLKKQAEQELRKMSDESSVVTQVKQLIIQRLSTGDLDTETTAETLNMSRATLYRKLKAESSSFNSLLTDIRKELAGKYVQSGMKVSQMAFLLGYSTDSNFMIAFKRWFGQNPGSYRQSIVS